MMNIIKKFISDEKKNALISYNIKIKKKNLKNKNKNLKVYIKCIIYKEVFFFFFFIIIIIIFYHIFISFHKDFNN